VIVSGKEMIKLAKFDGHRGSLVESSLKSPHVVFCKFTGMGCSKKIEQKP